MIADEIYQDVAFDGPVAPDRIAQPRCAGDLAVGIVQGVPGSRLAHRAGSSWAAVIGSTTCWLRITKLAEGRLCSTMPMQRAIVAGARRRPIASTGVSRGAARARGARASAGRTPSPALRRRGRAARFTRCRKSNCPPAGPTPTSSSSWCTRQAFSACTAQVSGWTLPTGTSAWSRSLHRRS